MPERSPEKNRSGSRGSRSASSCKGGAGRASHRESCFGYAISDRVTKTLASETTYNVIVLFFWKFISIDAFFFSKLSHIKPYASELPWEATLSCGTWYLASLYYYVSVRSHLYLFEFSKQDILGTWLPHEMHCTYFKCIFQVLFGGLRVACSLHAVSFIQYSVWSRVEWVINMDLSLRLHNEHHTVLTSYCQ